ncbi:MAG: CapA family protein [Candidatus Colwellbacteria bacterium]|nr:CapA family protein [Candidatus Colwellbacteria bacterium]
MIEIKEGQVTPKGMVIRACVAVVFMMAAAFGFWMVFSPVNAEPEPEDLSGNLAKATEIRTESEKVFMIAVGDIMLDRHVLALTMKDGKYDYPFRKIDDYLSRADIRFGNLESPMTSNSSKALTTNGMTFTIPTDYLSPLADRFDVLSLANNHMLDFGEEGFRETKVNLSGKGIDFFGDYLNRGDNTSTIVKKNGIKIGFVGYHELSRKGFDNVLMDIRKTDAICDMTIAVPHWGEEYAAEENELQRKEAEQMIDAGADLVIGGHPHVVQPVSSYKGKAIFWSLGNFVFDQYFSAETMKALSVTIEATKERDGKISLRYGLVPIAIDKASQPAVMEREPAKELLADIASRSDVSLEQKNEIESGTFLPAKENGTRLP